MKFCPDCGSKTSLKTTDNAQRYICQNDGCNYIHWNNPIPVVAALVKHDDNYLIARNTQWPKGIFSLITGYLEAGEEIEKAILREVKEELNLEGRIVNYLGHHMFSEKNQIILAFEVEASGKLKTNHELAETKYLSKSELGEYNFQPLYITEKVIQQWLVIHNK